LNLRGVGSHGFGRLDQRAGDVVERPAALGPRGFQARHEGRRWFVGDEVTGQPGADVPRRPGIGRQVAQDGLRLLLAASG
jgi:hypothetical protein